MKNGMRALLCLLMLCILVSGLPVTQNAARAEIAEDADMVAQQLDLTEVGLEEEVENEIPDEKSDVTVRTYYGNAEYTIIWNDKGEGNRPAAGEYVKWLQLYFTTDETKQKAYHLLTKDNMGKIGLTQMPEATITTGDGDNWKYSYGKQLPKKITVRQKNGEYRKCVVSYRIFVLSPKHTVKTIVTGKKITNAVDQDAWSGYNVPVIKGRKITNTLANKGNLNPNAQDLADRDNEAVWLDEEQNEENVDFFVNPRKNRNRGRSSSSETSTRNSEKPAQEIEDPFASTAMSDELVDTELFEEGTQSTGAGGESGALDETAADTPAEENGEALKIAGTLVWNDNDNLNEVRPEGILVKLLRKGMDEPVKTLYVAGDETENNWEWSFDDLASDENGEPVIYGVMIDPVPDYSVRMEKTADGRNVVVDCKYVPEATSQALNGTVTWNDGDNENNSRPEGVTVNLYVEGNIKASSYTTEEKGWAWSFDVYAQPGTPNTYVEVQPVAGYKASPCDTGIMLTKLSSWTIRTAWEDTNNAEGKRPASVRYTLYADNGQDALQTEQSFASENWQDVHFVGVPSYTANGAKAAYVVREDVPEGYYASYELVSEENGDRTLCVTNQAAGVVPVTIEWKDAEDADHIRPSSLSVSLVDDANSVVSSVTLRPENTDGYAEVSGKKVESTRWTGALLLSSDEGVSKDSIGMHIEAEDVSGYEISWKGNIVDGFTGEFFHDAVEPERGTLTGNVVWADEDNAAGKRPETVEVELWFGDALIASTQAGILTDWTWSFENVAMSTSSDENVSYTVRQKPVEWYYTTVDGNTITNTYDAEFATSDLSTKILWKDSDNYYKTRPDRIVMQLQSRTENGEWKDVALKTEVADASTAWEVLFKDLPLRDGTTGDTLFYRARQKDWEYPDFTCAPENENCSYTIIDGADSTESKGFESSLENVLKTQDIDVIVTWKDNNDRYGYRPNGIVVILQNQREDISPVSRLSWKKNGNKWTAKIQGVPVYVAGTMTKAKYSLVENTIDSYSIKKATVRVENNKASFVNTCIYRTVQLSRRTPAPTSKDGDDDDDDWDDEDEDDDWYDDDEDDWDDDYDDDEDEDDEDWDDSEWVEWETTEEIPVDEAPAEEVAAEEAIVEETPVESVPIEIPVEEIHEPVQTGDTRNPLLWAGILALSAGVIAVLLLTRKAGQKNKSHKHAHRS